MPCIRVVVYGSDLRSCKVKHESVLQKAKQQSSTAPQGPVSLACPCLAAAYGTGMLSLSGLECSACAANGHGKFS
jgi:hypothetical protein